MSDGTIFAAKANATRMGAACRHFKFLRGRQAIATQAPDTANPRGIRD